MTKSIGLCSLLFAPFSSLLARGDHCPIDPYRLFGSLSLSGRMIDCIRDFYPTGDTTKRRELAVEMVPVADQYEEMRRRAIGLFRSGHRDDAPDVLDVA